MDEWEGFRFSPAEDATVGCHLHRKLTGKTLLANEFINEISIYNFDPWELRFQSKLKWRDFVWYFFTPVENNYANGDRQKRTTSSGFWKITGDPQPILDRWGRWSGNKGPIGYKRVLRFHIGKTPNVGKAEWVMHEYHNTMVEPNLRTHVICRVEYKGDNATFISDNATEPCPAFVHHLTNSAGSVVDQSVPRNWGFANTLSEYDSANQSVQGNWGISNHLSEYNPANQIQHFSGNFNPQEQVHFASNDNEIPMLPQMDIEEIYNLVFNNGEPNSYSYMSEDLNAYQPISSVTKVFDEYNSDSDNESTLFGDTSSSVDSVGNPNELCSTLNPLLSSIDQHPTTELQTTYESSIGKEQSRQDYTNYKAQELKIELQEKEKVISELECKMGEDCCINKSRATKKSKHSMKKRTHIIAKRIYLRTITIAVLLLFSIIASTTLLR